LLWRGLGPKLEPADRKKLLGTCIGNLLNIEGVRCYVPKLMHKEVVTKRRARPNWDAELWIFAMDREINDIEEVKGSKNRFMRIQHLPAGQK
jgi:hypothetical protein